MTPPPPPRQPTLLEQTVTALALDRQAQTRLLHQAAALNIDHDDPAIVLLGAREAIKQEIVILRSILANDRSSRDEMMKEQCSTLPTLIWVVFVLVLIVSTLSFVQGSNLYFAIASKQLTWIDLMDKVGWHLLIGISVAGVIAGAAHVLASRRRP